MGNFNRDNRGGGRRSFPRRDFDRNRDFGGSRGGDRNRGGGGRDRGDRQMFSATCSNCGKDCKVPFQPTNSKPVYCSDCFEKMGGGRRDERPRFSDRRPQGDSQRGSGPDRSQFDDLNRKLDRIISLLDPQAKKVQPQQAPQPVKDKMEVKVENTKVEEPVKEKIVFVQDEKATEPAKETKAKKVASKKPAAKKTSKAKK